MATVPGEWHTAIAVKHFNLFFQVHLMRSVKVLQEND